MSHRAGTNSVSITASLVVFVLVGCLVAAGALWAGFEAAVVKFGLIAYLCIAGPLFLAAVLSAWMPSAKHRSFRPTPPPYMEGRRVKRRLLAISWASCILALAAALLTAVFVLSAIARMGAANRLVPFGRLLLCAAGGIAAYLTLFVLRPLFVSLGWMTPEEAKPFMQLRGGWPESWLEPVDEGEPRKEPGTE